MLFIIVIGLFFFFLLVIYLFIELAVLGAPASLAGLYGLYD